MHTSVCFSFKSNKNVTLLPYCIPSSHLTAISSLRLSSAHRSALWLFYSLTLPLFPCHKKHPVIKQREDRLQNDPPTLYSYAREILYFTAINL